MVTNSFVIVIAATLAHSALSQLLYSGGGAPENGAAVTLVSILVTQIAYYLLN